MTVFIKQKAVWLWRIGFVLGLLLTAVPTIVEAVTPLDVGYLDFSYPSGIGGNGAATSEKPESKLWHHDGYWWGSMWSDSGDAYHIFRLNWATQEWEDTGVELDDRLKGKADVLSDGNTLYVVSHIFNTNGRSAPAGERGELFRYTYSGGSYALDAGFPIEVNEAESETLTIAKDGTGMLWISWVQDSKVMVNHSNASGGGDTDWATPYELPVDESNVKSDDISSVVSFDGHVGIMYSRQTSGVRIYFAAHVDGAPTNEWTAVSAFGVSGDDHINIKSLQSDGAGKLFAAIKASQSSVLITLLVCDSSASSCTDESDWEAYTAFDGTYGPTRPLLLLDTSNRDIYIFVRPKNVNSNDDGADIYFKKTSMDDISFDKTTPGTPFIASTTYKDINDPTSTKQSVNASTGLVVLANDDREKVYVHNCIDLGGTPSGLCMATDSVAVARFSSAIYEVSETGAPAFEVTVELSKAAETAVSVDYTISDNTAVSPDDYSATNGTVNFAAGETSKTFTVSIVDDELIEPSETLDLALTDSDGVVISVPQTAVLTILDDDTPPTVHFSSESYQADEDSGGVQVDVVLDYAFDEEITVAYATSDAAGGAEFAPTSASSASATAGVDYTAISGTLTFAPGEVLHSIMVPLLADADYEDDETVQLELTSPTVATAGVPMVATLTIANDDAQPAVSFASDVASIGEAEASATLSVTLSAASFETIEVDVTSADGTATADEDYTAVSETVTFAPGELEKAVTVPILDDVVHEGDETAVFSLENPNNTTLVDSEQLTLTIVDDETAPTVQLTSDSFVIAENGVTQTVTVTLSTASQLPVTVDFVTSDLSTGSGAATAIDDYAAISETVTFAPGELSQLVEIGIVDDVIEEGNEDFNVTLSNPTVATLGTPAAGTVTIIDDDVPPSVQFSSPNFSGVEGDGEITVIVSLIGLSEQTVTVDYATVETTETAFVWEGSQLRATQQQTIPTDYEPVSGTLSFEPGETMQQIMLPLIDDAIDEITETVTIELSNIVNGLAGVPLTTTVTIEDDDEAPTIAFTSDAFAAGEGDETAVISVELSSESGKIITVDFASADETAVGDSDYTPIGGTLTFAPGVTEQSFAVALLDDVLDEVDETAVLTLANPTNSSLTEPMTATLTIEDDDAPPAVQFSLAALSVDEAAASATVTVTLDAPSAKEITVDFATLAGGTAVSGSDFEAASGTLTFASGETVQTFAVTIFEDELLEDDETVLLALSNATDATLGSPDELTLTIVDNDTPKFSFSQPEMVVGEDAAAFAVEISLSVNPPTPVQVSYEAVGITALSDSDFEAASGTLTFFPGDNLTQVVVITVTEDDVHEADEQFDIVLGNPQGAELGNPATLAIVIEDNDAQPTISVGAAEVRRSEMYGLAEIEVVLSAPSGQAVTVEYTTIAGTAVAGTDYEPVNGTMVFAPGEVRQFVMVPLHTDFELEGGETVIVELSNPNHATLGLNITTLTITDGSIYLPIVTKGG
ncbi:MAG: Calx-beta domain-containing protein [Chloroflexota bacterium]